MLSGAQGRLQPGSKDHLWVCDQAADVPDPFCADIQEKTCQISQKPFQDQVQRRKCSLKMKGDCSNANDVSKQCYTVQDDQDLNVLISPELSGHQTQGFLQQWDCPVQIINQIGPVQIIDPVLNIYSLI